MIKGARQVADLMAAEKAVARAALFAKQKHKGQVYGLKNGYEEPYYNHVRRVAQAVHQEAADFNLVFSHTYKLIEAAAYLHDTVEDAGVPREQLVDEFGWVIAETVWSVSRIPDEIYEKFITRAASHPLGRIVKRHDVLDNLAHLPSDHSLRKRYLSALELLL